MPGKCKPPPPDGTDRRYQWDRRNGREPTKATRAAHARAGRELRETNPQVRQLQRESDVVRDRARARLARMYPAVYLRLMDEERVQYRIEQKLKEGAE